MSEQSSQRALQNQKAPFLPQQEGPYRSILYQTQNSGTDRQLTQTHQNLLSDQNQIYQQINLGNTGSHNNNHSYLGQPGQQILTRQNSQYLIETSPFISNLYKAIDEQKFKNIIDWSENGGNYFVIYSMEKFKQQVLPQYFTTTSYSTFVRQLNKYGFRKVNIKKDEHIFYHPVFRADNRYQLHTIKRKRKGKDNVPQEFEQKLRAEILKHEEIKTQQLQQHANNKNQFGQYLQPQQNNQQSQDQLQMHLMNNNNFENNQSSSASQMFYPQQQQQQQQQQSSSQLYLNGQQIFDPKIYQDQCLYNRALIENTNDQIMQNNQDKVNGEKINYQNTQFNNNNINKFSNSDNNRNLLQKNQNHQYFSLNQANTQNNFTEELYEESKLNEYERQLLQEINRNKQMIQNNYSQIHQMMSNLESKQLDVINRLQHQEIKSQNKKKKLKQIVQNENKPNGKSHNNQKMKDYSNYELQQKLKQESVDIIAYLEKNLGININDKISDQILTTKDGIDCHQQKIAIQQQLIDIMTKFIVNQPIIGQFIATSYQQEQQYKQLQMKQDSEKMDEKPQIKYRSQQVKLQNQENAPSLNELQIQKQSQSQPQLTQEQVQEKTLEQLQQQQKQHQIQNLQNYIQQQQQIINQQSNMQQQQLQQQQQKQLQQFYNQAQQNIKNGTSHGFDKQQSSTQDLLMQQQQLLQQQQQQQQPLHINQLNQTVIINPFQVPRDPAIQKIIQQSHKQQSIFGQPKQCSISQRTNFQSNINADSPSSKAHNTLRNDDSIIINNTNSCSNNFLENQILSAHQKHMNNNMSHSTFFKQNNFPQSNGGFERFHSFNNQPQNSHLQSFGLTPLAAAKNLHYQHSGLVGNNNAGYLNQNVYSYKHMPQYGVGHTFFNKVSDQMKDDFFEDIQSNLDVPYKADDLNYYLNQRHKYDHQNSNALINQPYNQSLFTFNPLTNNQPEYLLSNQQIMQNPQIPLTNQQQQQLANQNPLITGQQSTNMFDLGNQAHNINRQNLFQQSANNNNSQQFRNILQPNNNITNNVSNKQLQNSFNTAQQLQQQQQLMEINNAIATGVSQGIFSNLSNLNNAFQQPQYQSVQQQPINMDAIVQNGYNQNNANNNEQDIDNMIMIVDQQQDNQMQNNNNNINNYMQNKHIHPPKQPLINQVPSSR